MSLSHMGIGNNLYHYIILICNNKYFMDSIFIITFVILLPSEDNIILAYCYSWFSNLNNSWVALDVTSLLSGRREIKMEGRKWFSTEETAWITVNMPMFCVVQYMVDQIDPTEKKVRTFIECPRIHKGENCKKLTEKRGEKRAL